MAFTKVTGPGINSTSNYETNHINSTGIITATQFVGPLVGSASGSSQWDKESAGISTTSKVGIGTTNPVNPLHVKGTGTDILKIESTDAGAQGTNLILQHSPGAGNMADNDVVSLLQFAGVDDSNNDTTYASIRTVATDVSNNSEKGDLTFFTRNGSTFGERLRIDSSGRLLHGTTASRSIADGTPNLQVEGTAGTASLGLVRNQNNSGGSNISFAKSRSGSLAGNTIVQDDDILGNINFAGADGTDINTIAARIVAAVDGTPGGNDIPGRLEFRTASGGTLYERVRISSAGKVNIGSNFDNPGEFLTVVGNISLGHRGDNVSRYIGKGTDTTNFGTIGDASSNANSSWIGFVSDSGTGYEDQIRFGTHKSGLHGGERMRLDGSGNLMIGTTTLGDAYADNLTIADAASAGITIRSATNGVGSIYFADGTTGDTRFRGFIEYHHVDSSGSGATDFFKFSTAATERLRIDKDGKVGIGITNPATKLEVNGNIKASNFAGRNKIINGAMRFNTRGGTHSYAHDGTTTGYNLDRFMVQMAGIDEYDCVVSQETTAPVGFTNSLKLTTGTAESAIAATEYCAIYQKIEGQNLQDLLYNTSSAKTVTMSFWVRSSVTGTYVFTVYRDEGTDRAINRTYTINTANTWEKKTLTIPGDISGSSIANNNGSRWWNVWIMASGSTYTAGESTVWEDYDGGNWAGGQVASGMMTTAGASFYLTGVQLEIGDTATEFEWKLYDEELASCQRYYIKDTRTRGNGGTSAVTQQLDSIAGVDVDFPVTMRATPSVTFLGTTFRAGGNSDAQDITPSGFSWGRKRTGAGGGAGSYEAIAAYIKDGYTANSEL